MKQLVVADIAEDEIETVVSLWQECGLTRPWNNPYNDIAFARSNDNSAVLVARLEEGGPIVASAMVGHDGHRGYTYYLSVSPEHQSAGLGKSMMKAVEEWHLAKGIWKSQLMVRTGNEKVISFYETLGYNISATQVLERWIDPSKRGDA
nr:GNAT family acetyltransferase [uncultured Cohaesibacter sp.]